MKCVKQFRYYGKNNSNNYPSNMTYEALTRQNVFEGYDGIVQMGIQAPRGTIMYLNRDQKYPIVIGETGIYEINLSNSGGKITAIRFASASLEALDLQGSSGRLLIDIIYEGTGADV